MLVIMVWSLGWAAAEEHDVVALPEMNVRATRVETSLQAVPVSVAIVTRDDIEESGAANAGELLRDVPGVELIGFSTTGTPRPLIRGETPDRILILVDGQKISEQQSMDGAPLLIAASGIDRIEVIRGPASALYGSEAIGGVVNIITRKGGTKPFGGSLGVELNSAADGVLVTEAVYGQDRGFEYRLSGAHSDQKDLEAASGRLDETEYVFDDYAAYFGLTLGKAKIGLRLERNRGSYEVHTPEDVINSEKYQRFELALPSWDRDKYAAFLDLNDLSGVLRRIHADVFRQETHKSFEQQTEATIAPQPLGWPPPVLWLNGFRLEAATENTQNSTGGNLQFDWQLPGANYLIAGIDAVRDELDVVSESATAFRTTPGPAPAPAPPWNWAPAVPTERRYDATMDTLAAYAQNEWQVSADSALTLGVRGAGVWAELDRTVNPLDADNSREATDSHAVFSAGLVNRSIPNLALRASFHQGYRTPTLHQLFTGTVHSGWEVLPNSSLDPETSDNFEIGARYSDGRLSCDVTVFYSEADEYIVTETMPVAGGQAQRRYVNADSVNSHGLELSADYSVAWPRWRLRPYAQATVLRRKYTGVLENGTEVSDYRTGHPLVRGTAGARAEIELERVGSFWLDAHCRMAGASRGYGIRYLPEGDRDAPVESGGWAVADLALGLDLGGDAAVEATLIRPRWRVVAGIENLFDKKYTANHRDDSGEELPGPGRNVYFKVGCDF